MPNPIASPFVLDVDVGEHAGLVHMDSRPDGVAVITLNHPATGNALSGALVAALTEALETLHGAEHVRIVFLSGAGGTFCAGADRAWMKTEARDWTEADLREEARGLTAMYHALAEVPALTVAMVQGEAAGAGAGLVAACDLAVAEQGARFAFPEVASGAVAALYAAVVIGAIGPRRAGSLFATGRTFDADYAERIGLVDEVATGAGGMHAAAERLIEQAKQNGPQAVAETKRMVRHLSRQDHDQAEAMARLFAQVRFGEEGLEGLNALVAGRRPGWAQD